MINQNKKISNQFVRYFLLINAFVTFVTIESSQIAQADFSYYSNQTEIELVVSAETNNHFQLFTLENEFSQNPTVDYKNLEFSSINKFIQTQHDHLVRLRLKSNQLIFNQAHQITTILQKKNIPHQSSDEDPPLLD